MSRCSYGYLPVIGGELAFTEETIGLTNHSSTAPTLAMHKLALLAPVGTRTPRALADAVVDVKTPEAAIAAIERLDGDRKLRYEAAARASAWADRETWPRVAQDTVRACEKSIAVHAESDYPLNHVG